MSSLKENRFRDRDLHSAFCIPHSALAPAFTLIELLVVVAIISIISAIALPNFLEAQVRSKVARTKADLHTLAVALEAYGTDNNCYPPFPLGLGQQFRRFIPLTTPIAYLTAIPLDPFEPPDALAKGHVGWREGLYLYGGTPIDAPKVWAMAGDGPDRQPDLNDILFYPGLSESIRLGRAQGVEFSLYDATNGTISRGDIFRASDYVMN